MGRGGRKRACDTCHARKIHCDGALPNCDWCSHQGLACTFERGVGKRAAERERPKNNNRVSKASATRKSSASGWAVADETEHHRSPVTLSPAESSRGWAWAESPLLATDSRDWIRRWAGESAILDLLSPIPSGGPPWQIDPPPRHPRLTTSENLTELPEKKIAELYLQLFRSTPFRLVFPIVDTVLFQDTINSAYTRDGNSAISSACVFAFLSIMSHMPWGPRSSGVFDGDACARQADSLMGLTSLETSIVELQFYVMQCMQKLFSGNLKAATMCHAVACRLLFMLGGHLYPQEPQPPTRRLSGTDLGRRTREHLRKLFWLCYTFDKIIALRTGEPPCIDDEQCDLTLPPGYADLLYEEGDFDAALVTAITLFPGDLRLSIIKSRTCKLLFNQVQKLSNSELLRIVRELDGDLEEWRLSIPLSYRPTLSSSDDGHGFTPDMDSTQKMHIIMIHLEYHHLMATIHGITSRSFAWSAGDGVNLVNPGLGISSSQALSVEASRASLEYLRVASHALLSTTFWIVVFYPLKAILTIMGNILLDPLQPAAERDMLLLDSTARLIQQIRAQRSIPIDNQDIARMDSFVSEVIRSGKSTVATAAAARKRRERQAQPQPQQQQQQGGGGIIDDAAAMVGGSP
ncbi:uncharacterized protein L3040_003838 [Drepanopeziza brunnea f. sp. 'multigermtubi']|uniref:uncharacterized protein n=1 Tax=Drepanopeziza brunnea f. sp. 'multigermtubi' TaxID=698441 RepID=UPI002395B371|nr:hypothetical protein L3040_003838 [Drepanopeziza brunnea f. sp. 'multigermtubi']